MWWLLEMNSSGKNSSSDIFFYVRARIKKTKRKKVKWSAKMNGQVRYVCDDSLSNDHSVIKVWKCHQRSAAYQLLKHYGSVICCNICVRPKELYSKGCSECSLKRCLELSKHRFCSFASPLRIRGEISIAVIVFATALCCRK